MIYKLAGYLEKHRIMNDNFTLKTGIPIDPNISIKKNLT